MVSQVSTLITGFVFFAVVLNTLGQDDFGRYGAVIAMTFIALPFATMGVIETVQRDVARDPSRAAQAYGRGISTVLVFGVLVTIPVVIAAAIWASDVPSIAVILFMVSQVLNVIGIQLPGRVYSGSRLYGRGTAMTIIFEAMRLAGIVVFALLGSHNLTRLAFTLVVVNALAAVVSIAYFSRSMGRPTLSKLKIDDLRESSPFAFSTASATILEDFDKIMLVGFGFPAAAGVYTAGNRIRNYAYLPLASFLGANYPRFFADGKNGIAATLARFRRMLPLLFGAGMAIALVLILGRELASKLTDDGYTDLPLVVALLAMLVPLGAIRRVVGDVLKGAGYQRDFSIFTVVAGLLNLGLNFYFIPKYEWRGAVFTTYASELAYLGMMSVAIQRKLAHETQAPEPEEDNFLVR